MIHAEWMGIVEHVRWVHLVSVEGEKYVYMVHAAWKEGETHVPVIDGL